MKKMILAATAVGAALAGTLLYARKKGNIKALAPAADPADRAALPARGNHAMG